MVNNTGNLYRYKQIHNLSGTNSHLALRSTFCLQSEIWFKSSKYEIQYFIKNVTLFHEKAYFIIFLSATTKIIILAFGTPQTKRNFYLSQKCLVFRLMWSFFFAIVIIWIYCVETGSGFQKTFSTGSCKIGFLILCIYSLNLHKII